MSVAQVRADLAQVIRDCESEPVQILRRGEPVAVVVSSDVYERLLEAMEDFEDIRDLENELKSASPRVPWQQVKADLGLA